MLSSAVSDVSLCSSPHFSLETRGGFLNVLKHRVERRKLSAELHIPVAASFERWRCQFTCQRQVENFSLPAGARGRHDVLGTTAARGQI